MLKNPLPNKVDINSKIRKWYWASVFLNRYSSSVESTSTKDYLDLIKWFSDDSVAPDLILDFLKSYKELNLKDVAKGSATYNAIFNILILNEARDWETFELPEYESLDDHHIVLYSWGKENSISNINSILNRTPISAHTNKFVIGSTLPNDYMERMFKNNDSEKVYNVLQTHLISKEAVQVLLRKPLRNLI